MAARARRRRRSHSGSRSRPTRAGRAAPARGGCDEASRTRCRLARRRGALPALRLGAPDRRRTAAAGPRPPAPASARPPAPGAPVLEPYRFNPRERTARAWPPGRRDAPRTPSHRSTARCACSRATRWSSSTPARAHLGANRPDAAQLLEQAAKHAPPGLAADAFYNLGNARLAAKDAQGAIDAYKSALRAQSDLPNAKRNLELALRLLEEQQAAAGAAAEGLAGQAESAAEAGAAARGRTRSRTRTSSRSPILGSHRTRNRRLRSREGRQRASRRRASRRRRERPLPQFQDQKDMTAEQAAAILQAVENLERQQRREQARALAARQDHGGERLVRTPAASAARRLRRSSLLLGAVAVPLAAEQRTEATAVLEPGLIGVDELASFTITVTSGGFGGLDVQPAFELDNLEVAGGPFQSQSQRWVNGKTSSTLQLTWRLRPKGAGAARVRAIALTVEGQALRLSDKEIEVQQAAPPRRQPGSGAAGGAAAARPFDPFDDLFGHPSGGRRRTQLAAGGRAAQGLPARRAGARLGLRRPADRPTRSGSTPRPMSAPFNRPGCPPSRASGCARSPSRPSSSPSGWSRTANASAASPCCAAPSFPCRPGASRSSRPRSISSRGWRRSDRSELPSDGRKRLHLQDRADRARGPRPAAPRRPASPAPSATSTVSARLDRSDARGRARLPR